MTRLWTAAAVLAVSALAACSSTPSAPAAPTGDQLAAAVTVDGVWAHLAELQKIADAHDGDRADGTPGYQASVDYVAQKLRDRGFDVSTPEFQRLSGSAGGRPGLTIAGRPYRVDQASLLLTTPAGGLRARTTRPPRAAGCAATDYGSTRVAGQIVVVDDTGCSIVDKHAVAVARGAVGLLVVTRSTPDRPAGAPAGLFTSGYYRALTVPTGIIDPGADAALRRTDDPVTLVLDNRPQLTTSRNVLAQSKTGRTDNVVVVGAHLDSVRSGPGINDNGTGVAAVLETALQLGPQSGGNAVRFAFWGAQEISVDGATDYLRSLTPDQRNDIALYLDVDTLGSTNPGYFTVDGDQSAATVADPPPLPDGSAGIERTLAGRLNLEGRRPADTPLTRQADYAPFLAAGIPAGGVTAGSSGLKTPVQARIWGGRANAPFDPNYHTRRDTLDSVDRDALGVLASATAFAVGSYAQSTDGVNGVPGRDGRNRRAP